MVAAEAFLVVLRESIEAFLILGILTGLTVKLGHREGRRPLYLGALSGVALSVILGLVIRATAQELFEAYEAAFEGIAALVAVAILTYMIVWMYQHTITLVSKLREKARDALEAGKPAVLFGLAFVAVFREGVETVLFLGALAPETSGGVLVLTILAGIGAAGLLAFLLFQGILQLSLQNVFAVTGVLLILFGGGLLAGGLHELAEAGYIPETAHLWDTSGILSEDSTVGGLLHAMLGYEDHPTLTQALAYLLYVGGFGAWYLRGLRMADEAGSTVAEA